MVRRFGGRSMGTLRNLVLGNALCTVLLPASAGAQTSGFVYVIVEGTPNRILGFAVNAATGALTALPGFPISMGGGIALQALSDSLAYDPVHSRLYALRYALRFVAVFDVNRTTGALAPTALSPISLD